MSKLGVCVRYEANNYGSMLQIFATQVLVEEQKWDYEFIRYNRKTLFFMVKNVTRIFNPYYMRGVRMRVKKRVNLSHYPDLKEKNRIRVEKINEFRKKYFKKYSPVYKGYSKLSSNASRYDAVLVGSDQLWTPSGLGSKFYNLLFVPDKTPKIALATSFGVNKIPWYQRRRTEKYLKRINYISVREIRGKQIIKELVHRDVRVVIDPTLMLRRKEWDKYIESKRVIDGEYIFCYFLGTNVEHRKVVEEIKNRTNLRIVTIPHMDDFVKADLDFGDEQLFDVGPEEFLNLIRGAKYICTDSFHGTVFSILNHKKFVVFDRFATEERQSRNSRIETLCCLLGLEKRRYQGELYEQMLQEIDYDVVDKQLERLRRQSKKFLKESLMYVKEK